VALGCSLLALKAMWRSHRIEPLLRRVTRVALLAFLPALAGTGLALLAAGRSKMLGTIAFVIVAMSIVVAGVAIIVAFCLTIALFFSRT
jgi:hypothetical protein